MPASQLDTQVRRRPGVALIDLTGEIDGSAEESLNAAYEEATTGETGTVLLNFGGVDYINSTGIALIVGLLAQARKDRIDVTACGLAGLTPGPARDVQRVCIDSARELAERAAT